MPQWLPEKRAEAGARVRAQVARTRAVVVEKAPAVESAMRERPLVVGGVLAALLLLFVRSLLRRRTHGKQR